MGYAPTPESSWGVNVLTSNILMNFQLTAIDEIHVEQTKTGHVIKQLCRVRVFFLSFLTGQNLRAAF